MTETMLLAAHEPLPRGYFTILFWFLFGIAGTLFPHLLAGQFLDEPGVVRWIAVPMLIVCGFMLADHHFDISKGWF